MYLTELSFIVSLSVKAQPKLTGERSGKENVLLSAVIMFTVGTQLKCVLPIN